MKFCGVGKLSAPRWIGHDVLMRTVLIEAYFKNEEPLRIGSGKASAKLSQLVDLPVIRILKLIDGRPVEEVYVPGSSIKGTIRSTAERLAKARGLDVCSGLGNETCMSRNNRMLERRIEELLRNGDLANARELIWKYACLHCKLFGAPSLSSHIDFSDAYPTTSPVSIGVKPGVAISRRTGAVERGALYQVEYVQPGHVFKLDIHGTNLPNYALGLLSAALLELHEGRTKLGGFKTRGFGRVSFSKLSITLKDYTGKASVKGEEVTLEPLDDLDKSFQFSPVVKQDSGFSITGDHAFKALRKLAKECWDDFDVPRLRHAPFTGE